MARKVSPPVYSLHKGRGQTYTRINGRMVYLGQYDSPDSKTRYAEMVEAGLSRKVSNDYVEIIVGRFGLVWWKDV